MRLVALAPVVSLALAMSCQPAPQPPAAIPVAEITVDAPPAASSAPLVAASSAPAASTLAPTSPPPWTGPVPPGVPSHLAETYRKLASLGPVKVEGAGQDVSLICEACGPAGQRLSVAEPAVDGSFTGPGLREAAIVASGDCAVIGRVWGCTVLVERREDGGWRWKTKADVLLHAPRVVRLADGRDVLVGPFVGSQMGGTWHEVFVLDFRNEDPIDSVLVLARPDVCTSAASHTADGSIDGLALEDRNKDGALDLVLTVRFGERAPPRGWMACKELADGVLDPGFSPPRATAMRLVFLRDGNTFTPDAATKALLVGKHNLYRRQAPPSP